MRNPSAAGETREWLPGPAHASITTLNLVDGELRIVALGAETEAVTEL